MNLQSIENWCLYYATTYNDVEMLKLYRCVNHLNENISNQARLDSLLINDNELNM